MNFNNIDKKPIDKGEFDSFFGDISKNSNEICLYLYKIANIIANNYRLSNLDTRENMIQDSVYVAYRRINSFDVSRGKSAFGYFFKMISNHFKDILRKDYRRKNIATFVSYDLSEDNSIKYVCFSDNDDDKKCKDDESQFCFIRYNEFVNQSSMVRHRRKDLPKECELGAEQVSFLSMK